MCSHIERMEQEFTELADKINKAFSFLEKEKNEPKFTDEVQREHLKHQLHHMIGYREALRNRIDYDTDKTNSEELKDKKLRDCLYHRRG